MGRISLLSRFRHPSHDTNDQQMVGKAGAAIIVPHSDVPKQRHSSENAPLLPPLSKTSNGRLSRSRTILRFLVTKIRPSATQPPMSPLSAPPFPVAGTHYSVRPPSPINTDAAKERREAALRDRGLLPPLRPKKDSERGRQPLDETQVSISGSAAVEIMTPAYLIKKEWEAKNRVREDEERERLQSFRYGTASFPSANEPQTRGQPSTRTPTPDSSVPRFSGYDDTAPPQEPPETLEQVNPSISPLLLNTESPRDGDDGIESSGCFSSSLVPLPPSPPPPPPSGSVNLTLEPHNTASRILTALHTDTISHARETRERSDSWPVSSASESSLATPLHDTPQPAGGLSIFSPFAGVSDIPTIVENPMEESLLPEKPIVHSNLDIINEETHVDQLQSVEPFPSWNKPRRRRRTVFGDEHLPKHLTVSASLTNLRRSVTSTLARAKSSVVIKGTKPAEFSDVPPLPSSPLSLRLRTDASSQDALPSPQRRQPVAPRLHSRGSILIETSAIEDDEARRVAELAFLG